MNFYERWVNTMQRLMHELSNLYKAFTNAENEEIKQMWEKKWYEKVTIIANEIIKEKEKSCD